MSAAGGGYQAHGNLRAFDRRAQRPGGPPEEIIRMTHEDHDTVVVERGGSGMGAIVGVIVVLLLLAGFWYFALGPGKGTFSGTSDPNINVNVSVPTAAPAGS